VRNEVDAGPHRASSPPAFLTTLHPSYKLKAVRIGPRRHDAAIVWATLVVLASRGACGHAAPGCPALVLSN